MTEARCAAGSGARPVLAGLTARQLAILTVTALQAALLFAAARPLLPLPVATALAAPPLLVGVALALGRRGSSHRPPGISPPRPASHPSPRCACPPAIWTPRASSISAPTAPRQTIHGAHP